MPAFKFDYETHQYFIGDTRVAGITEALQGVGLKPSFAGVPSGTLEKAAERGSVVHEMCKLDDAGQLGSYDKRLEAYLFAWRKFRDDFGLEGWFVEVPMGHKVYYFGGTPDFIGYSKKLNSPVVVERKTCDLHDWIDFQLAGQYLLAQQEEPQPSYERWAVKLNKDGTYKVRQFSEYGRAAKLFLSAVAIMNYRIKTGTA